MPYPPTRRLGAAIVLAIGIGVAACGGGGSDEASLQPAAASTLLDDDGLPMPSDPAAVPPGGDPRAWPRHATAAQAKELRRALGPAATVIEVACCGDAVIDAAIAGAVQNGDAPPLAVLLEGVDRAAAMEAATRLHASGLERVWVVSP